MDLYKSERTKYDVPLTHLDYGYIENCQDTKELEKIVKILRTGYEGTYVELQKLAENKLEQLNPTSRALRKDKPISTKHELELTQRQDIETDLLNWENDVKSKENRLKVSNGDAESSGLPPIRGSGTGTSHIIPIDKNSEVGSKKQVMPRSYNEWDKIDIEAELAKVDMNSDNQKKPQSNIPIEISQPEPSAKVPLNITEDQKSVKADQEKSKGNRAFRSGDYEEALLYYRRSISFLPTIAAYNNRAQTYIKMKKWKEALSDCDDVLSKEPENIKGHLRRAVAEQGLHDFVKAKSDIEFVLSKEPNNTRAKDVLNELERSLKEQKVKGRRMIIEEIDGSDEESEDKDTKISEDTVDKSKINDDSNSGNNQQTSKPRRMIIEEVDDSDEEN